MKTKVYDFNHPVFLIICFETLLRHISYVADMIVLLWTTRITCKR